MKKMLLKHKKRISVGTGLLIVLITAGILGYNFIQAGKVKSQEETVPPAVEQEDNRLVFWGEVTYDRIYDISIDFPAIVTDVKVKEGDYVSPGQTLLTLDMSEYLAAVDKLREQLAAGQAGLQSILQDTAALGADIAQTQKDISTKTEELSSGTNADLKILQTALDLAQKEAEDAKRDVENNRDLYDEGAISQNALDQAIDLLAQREKALADVENNIKKTKSALKTELDQLNIALKSKRAQLDQIRNANSANTAKQNSSIAVSQIDLDMLQNKSVKDYLNSDRIVSCVQNGIVQNIGAVNGTRLGVQNTPTRVLQLIDADSITVSAEIDEEFIKNVAPGDIVAIVPVSDSSLSIPGTVVQIANVAVEKDGKRIIKVRVKPEDPGKALKPGYSVDVFLPAK